MFQNITDIEGQQDNLDNKKLYRLRKIFRIQNLVIYILTFLISSLSIKGQIMPFGLAMIAACVGESIPLIGVFISAVSGTLVGNGLTSLWNMLIILAVYLFLVLFTKPKVALEERNEEIKSGGKLFTACFLVPLIKGFIGVFLWYDVFMSVISAGITYVFYKIFVNGLAVIRDLDIKKVFTAEELIASILIISLASLAFNGVTIFSLNISNIIIILLIMILGWQNGVLVGATAGAAIGLTTCLVDNTSLIQMFMFAISGILSGALNRFGKIGVIVGFILGNAILTYWMRGATTIIIYIREIFIASIGLLFIPKTIKINLEDIYGKDKMIDNMKDNRLEEGKQEDISQRLKNISDMFSNFIEDQSNKEIEKTNIEQELLENLNQSKKNMFFDLITDVNTGISKDICVTLIKNDILLDTDLISILKEHNTYIFEQDIRTQEDIREIVKIANKTLKVVQTNTIKAQERKKNIEAFNEEIKSVTKVIDKCVDDINNTDNKFSSKENEIELILCSKGIDVSNCEIKQIENKKYIIELKLSFENIQLRERNTITGIANDISKVIGKKIVFQRERIDEDSKEYKQVYSNEDKYILQVASGRITKDGSNVSGDCSLQIKLADSKYLLAIADGMGSGEKAREYSKLTLRLIKQLLSAGFNKEESIKLINSRLSLIGETERFSTLDITILDLFAGKIEILKNGACDTYIKNGNNISKIVSKSMPLGIVNSVEIQSQTITAKDGEMIVMCSDGIVDSRDDGGIWLEEFLKGADTSNVQKLADLILAEALDNNSGLAQDDMTVIISKIVKRK